MIRLTKFKSSTKNIHRKIMIKNKATNGRPYDIYFGSIINSIEKSVGEISNAFFIYLSIIIF